MKKEEILKARKKKGKKGGREGSRKKRRKRKRSWHTGCESKIRNILV